MPDLVVPALGESITEAVVGRWHKSVGDSVEADEPIVALETDKITVDLPAPSSGSLTEQRVSEGDTVKVGDVIGIIGQGQAAAKAKLAGGAKPAEPEPAKKEEVAKPKPEMPAQAEAPTAKQQGGNGAPAAAAPAAAPTPSDGGARRLTPSQRRAQLGGGRLEQPSPQPANQPPTLPGESAPAPAPAAPAAAKAPQAGADEDVVPMTPIRKRIAERLVQAQHSTASLTTFNEVDMSAVIELREQYKQEFADRHGVKLGFMSFFAKAAVAALQEYPGLNAEVREDAIVYKKRYDFGVAVSTERGLLVPVLRDVDRLSFAGIENGIADLAVRARGSKLTLDELVGGTFSITNGGIYGSMLSTPLLNYPQTGILGMHNIVKRPWAVGESIELRPIMYLALTYDHRVVDGREAVSFLVAVKERIEKPDRLMFDL